MREENKVEKSYQWAALILLLSVIAVVLLFAGSFDSVADHASIAWQNANELYSDASSYVGEMFASNELEQMPNVAEEVTTQ